MIKKNGGTGRPSQSPHHVNLKSERTNRNDSECSFTLTDDEEHRLEGGRRSSSQAKRAKSEANPIIYVQPEATKSAYPYTSQHLTVKEEPVEEEDQFLKELEEENKLLEEELKQLQEVKG